MASQRNRSSRGPNRNGGQGDELNVWQTIKDELHKFVELQNSDNENVEKIVTQDRYMAQNADTMNAEEEERKQEELFRKGVRKSEAVSDNIKGVINNLELLLALKKMNEEEGEPKNGFTTPSRSGTLTSGLTRNAGRAGMREREKERERERDREREREREREQEREREREQEREREREREQEKEKEREREREKEREQRESEKEREREREKEKGREKERERERERERDINKGREKDPYEFEGPGDEMEIEPPAPAPHTRKQGGISAGGNGDRSSNRDSIPPRSGTADRETPAKADSLEPQGPNTTGIGSNTAASVSQRSKVNFVKGQDVVFKPKAGPGEPTEWFLGKVQQVLGEGKSRRYKVKDEDPDVPPEDRQEYRTGAGNMIPLPPSEQELPELESGKTVLALYPDSTTFYKAEVIATNKISGKVNLRFEGEENSGTLQEVERRFVVEYRS